MTILKIGNKVHSLARPIEGEVVAIYPPHVRVRDSVGRAHVLPLSDVRHGTFAGIERAKAGRRAARDRRVREEALLARAASRGVDEASVFDLARSLDLTVEQVVESLEE